MERPYIFCHMMTSPDGKIMGNYMEPPTEPPPGMPFTTSPSEKTRSTNIRAGCPAE